MKKILFFRPLMSLGGTEMGMLGLIKNLKGYDIYLGYSDDGSDKNLLNRYKEYAKVVNIRDLNVEFDIVVIATNRYHTIPELANIKRKRTILWVHYLMKIDTSVFTKKDEIEQLDKIVVVSKTAANDLLKLFPYLKGKIQIIYNVIDSQNIIDKSMEKVELDFSHDLNLVTTARICEEKGFPRMAYLAKLLKEKN